MENSAKIFALALGLDEPWFIEKVAFDEPNSQLDIYINFTRGHKFSTNDGQVRTAYDTVERKWQHLNFFQHKCFLHARGPRVKQGNGKILTQSVPWARSGSGFTLLFQAFSMLLVESEMPVSKAAKLVQVYPQRLWNVFNYWISRAHKQDEIEDLEQIGFDETSTKKGHNYVTTLVDLKERRVLFATKGKGSDTIDKSVDYLKQKEVPIKKIKQVCIDMSPSFISGCKKYLPEAAVTFDKFHVVKEINKAMDELRKSERKGNPLLKGHKYTFLKNRLSPKIQPQKHFLLEQYPKLGEGYRLKQMFNDFWEIKDPDEAEGYLAYWCDLARESKIQPFIKAVETIQNHWRGIVNYIKSKINNGILEGLNSKIQLAKKRARGYRNIDNFINMIYFIAGKLKFDYPQYII